MQTDNQDFDTNLIIKDLQNVSSKTIEDFQLIRAKDGVHVYKCLYDGTPAVVKYFEKEDDKREILNYRILMRHGIPTIKPLALGKAALVLEDISVSEYWRLGVKEDMSDADVTKCLARWYFTFHENGASVPELDGLYYEFDSITEDNLNLLIQKLPEAKETFQFVLNHLDKLQELIYQPTFTLTYNDFYWTNFVVRKDKQAAMMFDYNLLGKGYRYSDFFNAGWSMSEEARSAFIYEYNRLFFEKHGYLRTEEEQKEKDINEVAAALFALIVAFGDRESFPDWAEKDRNEAVNGGLLLKVKKLLM